MTVAPKVARRQQNKCGGLASARHGTTGGNERMRQQRVPVMSVVSETLIRAGTGLR